MLFRSQGTPVILTYRLHGNLFPNRDASCMDRVYHTSVTCMDCDARLALFTLEDRTEVSNRIKEARDELGKRIETEKLLRAALEEKNVLFREIHHRVKNNLNTIIGLINLQTDTIDDESTKAHLLDLESRIQSFSLLHETLYRQDVYDSIDAAVYLEAIVSSLQQSAGGESLRCGLQLSSSVMQVKQALYLGLALVELMTNAMKYGASADGLTRIDVSFHSGSGGAAEMRVRDYGKGIASAETSGTKDSLGIRLVSMMADELSGSIRFENPPGGGTLAILGFSTGSERI